MRFLMPIVFLYIGTTWVFAYCLRSQVNARLPRGETCEIWPNCEYWRMLRLHKNFYPNSRLRLIAYVWEIGGFLSMALFLGLRAIWR